MSVSQIKPEETQEEISELRTRLAALQENFSEKLPQEVSKLKQLWERLVFFKWNDQAFDLFVSETGKLSAKVQSLEDEVVKKTLSSMYKIVEQCMETKMAPNDRQRRDIGVLMNVLVSEVIADPLLDIVNKPVEIVPLRDHKGLIVVVDDDQNMREYLWLYLDHYGYQVRAFSEPAEARAFIETTTPDAIVMDVMFPESREAGIERADELRKINSNDIPIIFLSAREDFEARLQAEKVGDAYFTKPVDMNALTNKLEQLSDRHNASPYQVMVISTDNQQMEKYSSQLRDAGMIVIDVSNPRHIIRDLSSMHLDLILIDAELSDVDSLAMAAMIRKQNEYGAIPIVMVADSFSEDKQLAAANIGVDYIRAEQSYIPLLQGRALYSRESRHKLQFVQNRDVVTHLYNRQYFMQRLSLLAGDIARGAGTCSILYLKVINLGLIRGSSGLEAADFVLCDIARILGRKASNSAIIARYADDVFTVSMRNIDSEQSEKIARQLYQSLKSYRARVGQQVISVISSIGVACFDTEVPDHEQMLAQAEIACDAARDLPNDHVHLYERFAKDDAETSINDAETEAALQRALQEDGFYLAFQRVVHLHGDGTDKFEVLLRMKNEQGEEVSPGKFIPVAVENHMMSAIDRWVVENAIKTIAATGDEDDAENFKLFVKISTSTLEDDGFPQWVGERIIAHGINSRDLIFEMPAALATRHISQVKFFIRHIKSLGCEFALEHVGKDEYNSGVMEQLPADYIKIDGSLTRGLGKNTLNQAEIRIITDKAHQLECKTVAEFIEEATSLTVLWNCGMDYIQGNFLQEATSGICQPESKSA